jgi:hypothetical protein
MNRVVRTGVDINVKGFTGNGVRGRHRLEPSGRAWIRRATPPALGGPQLVPDRKMQSGTGERQHRLSAGVEAESGPGERDHR